MIFNTSDDIIKDIKNRISNHIKDIIESNLIIDTNNIISLLRTYLHELEIRNEIKQYYIDDDKKDNVIRIIFQKENNTTSFKVNIDLELRKLKIIKIQNSEFDKKTLEKFLL